MTSYKSTTKGKAVMMPQDFKCPNCGNIEEHWSGGKPTCNNCPRPMTDRITGVTVQMYYEMEPIFTPKNNSQRVYICDERR